MTRGRPGLPGAVETGLLVVLGFVAVQAALIPLELAGGMVAPDLVYGLVVAWVIRRPASTPLWAIVALGLFADLMLSRPVGLGALGLVLVAETFRAQAARFTDVPFPLEWLAAAGGFLVMLAGMQLALELVFADPPAVSSLLRHAVATAIAYPLIVFGLTWCLGLRALPAGQRPGERRLR
jgi:rod shape-determining protein MreD